MVSFCEIFVKIKIQFRTRIRIRIMILLWISIPDLYFIHRRHPPNFVWIRWLLRKLLYPQTESTYVRTARQTARQTDIQTGRRNFFCLFCVLRYTKHEYSSKGKNFFFQSCDYNTFSFYIIRMGWESEKFFSSNE